MMSASALARRCVASCLIGVATVTLVGAGVAASASAATRREAVLTGITGKHRKGYDEIVFQFAGRTPRHAEVRYRSLPQSSAGQYPTITGGALAMVSFSRATGIRGGALAYGTAEQSFALPGVIQVVTVSDANGTLVLGVNVARRAHVSLHVRANRDQVVVDVRTPGRIGTVGVAFVSARRASGATPTQSVERPVLGRGTLGDAIERLFAGPTQTEQADGLTFISSGATGARVSLDSSGVARVYLSGGCDAGGSAVNIATELDATLMQFRAVRSVKIYGPTLTTEHPNGLGNSIPSCLVPRPGAVKSSVVLTLLGLGALGVLIGLVLAAMSIAAALWRKPNVITPSAYVAEQVVAHPVPVGHFEPDAAWPVYPLRQMRADLASVRAELQARYARLWRWPGGRAMLFVLPVSVPAAVCLLVAGLTIVLVAAAFTIVMWACAAVVLAAYAAARSGMRGAESLWQKVMRTEASCPHCYHVTARPAYRCCGCDRLHRDIRPGRLGVLARRCECGALLPTMVLRAAWRLDPACQRCGQPLRVGAAALRDVRVPIFGDTSAGKTRFMYAGLDSLMAATSRTGMPLTFPDKESEREANLALGLVRSGQDTVKTSVALPTALTCRIGHGAGATLLHLFDAAGEHYRGSEMQESLTFLDHGHGLVYVLDPFAVGVVNDRTAGQSSPAIQAARAAAGEPELAYEQVVSRLRDSGVAASSQRLAVVVSKADLLAEAGIQIPSESAAIADWLSDAGVHNLVLSARRTFAEVRYFSVASLAAGSAGQGRDPGAPLHWLLAARGARLPGEEDGVASRRNGEASSEKKVRNATAGVRP